MKTTRYFILFTTFFFLGYHVTFASSSLSITEVMYDHEGTDEGKEWIEIQNNGTESIPIASWYFFENEVHHKLTPLNFENLAPGERAVIVQNEANFKSEFTNSAIKIIKSSFSLNNEGETIELRNKEKVSTSSVTYDPSVGGAGNGTTYGLIGSTWTMTDMSPGLANKAGQASADDEDTDESDSDEDDSDETTTEYSDESDAIELPSKVKEEFEPYYRPYINFETSVLAKNASRYRIGVFHVEEDKNTQEIDGFYYVNFGDGTGVYSETRIDTYHAYPSSGNYVLTFEFYNSKLAREIGEDPDVLYRKTIKVLDETISVLGLDTYGGIILENNNKQSINIQDWKIVLPGKIYTFPKYSMISGKSKIVVSPKTLGFNISTRELLQLSVINNDTIKIASYSPEKLNKNEGISNEVTSAKSLPTNQLVQVTNLDDTIQLGPHSSFIDEYLEKNPQAGAVDFASQLEQNASPIKQNSSTEVYLATGGGLLALGLGLLRFLPKKEPSSEGSLEEKTLD